MTSAIIMAAGKGTRMKTEHAKTMHKVLDKPMLQHIYDTLQKVGVDDIVFVVGHGADEIKSYFGTKVHYAIQSPQLGSGHAVMQATSVKNNRGKTLIINGDCPLIQPETYEKLLKAGDEYPLVLLTTEPDDAASYGRIIRNEAGEVLRIVEKKDANEEELKVREINVGIYCVNNEMLWNYLPEIKNNNAQKEYYVTDLVEIFRRHGYKVGAVVADDWQEMSGINNRKELAAATRWLQMKTNNFWMDRGVSIVSPETTFISPDAEIGEDTVIYGNVRIEGKTTIGVENTITEGTYIKNSQIGDYNTIISSRILDSRIGNNKTLGPWENLTGAKSEETADSKDITEHNFRERFKR